MAKGSVAYYNMKRALLSAVQDIPFGKVVEVSNLGVALNIPARHVSYILSTLTDDEADVVSWQRVIPKSGKFPKPDKQKPRHAEQINLLLGEGFGLKNGNQIIIRADAFWQPDDTHKATFWADEN